MSQQIAQDKGSVQITNPKYEQKYGFVPLDFVYTCDVITIWSANSRTVLRVNFLEQKLNRSSKLGPRSSITMTL